MKLTLLLPLRLPPLAKLGKVPNLFAHPWRMRGSAEQLPGFSDHLGKGILTTKQREIVALAVAQYNQCQYCLSAHNMMGRGAGLTAEDVTQARTEAPGMRLTIALPHLHAR
ncbi:MAG: carboxymuconolactone decarboxylase family protein [Halioglobus sp.]